MKLTRQSQCPGAVIALRSLQLMAMAALALPAIAAQATETIQTSCGRGDLVRRVVVVENSLSSGISCEVVYWKDTEAPDVRNVLWTARMDTGYCYSRALTLVGKLASLGWACDSVSSPVGLTPRP